MPVRFRGVSEYSSVYKWQPSYRSAQFLPSDEQIHPEAGLRSDQQNLLIEPSFAKKKQVPHRRPEAGSCLMWFYDNVEDSASEISIPEKNEVKSKAIAKPKKSAADRVSAKKDKQYRATVKERNKENQEKSALNDSKCTWERDQQSEYIQKIREKMKAEEANAKASKKKTTPTKKQQHSSQKALKSKQASPTKGPREASPAKPKQKTPTKDSKRSPPLRYRPLHHRMLSSHQSEYQQMYKKPSRFVPSSPLISALDVVHSHSPAIPPHKSPKMFTKSEYASKFQSQSPLSKSVPSFSSPPSPSMRMKVRDFTSAYGHRHHSPKRVESEYAHQFPERNTPSVSMRVQDEARHNKLNRDGSVFDKDHMTQICSPNNKCWEVSSVSTGSEATATTNGTSERDCRKNEITDEVKMSKLETLLEQEEAEEDDDDVESIIERDSLDTRSAVTSSSLNQPMPVARKLAWGNDDEDSTVQGSVAETKSDSSSSSYEGRLTTPQLNQFGGALRTHLDLTTPSHGALLTSPSSSDKKKRLSQSANLKQVPCQDLNLDEKPVKLSKTMPSPNKQSRENVQKTIKVSDTLPAPVANEPSGAKVNEKRASPEAKPTSNSPKKSRRKPDVPRFLQPTVRVPIQGALRSQEFQHCGKRTRPSTDFDRISVASCASIASADDLLQRSLQRQDFWKTK